MRLFVPLLVPLAAMLAAPAHAQIIIGAESPGRICYEHALAGRDDSPAVRDCVAALSAVITRRNRAATHVNLGIVRMRAGELEEALGDFDRAEALGGVPVAALAVNRSSALIRLGRHREAIAQTDIAIAAASSNLPQAWFNRGVALEAQGDLDGAYAAYLRARELRPGWRLPERELERFRVDGGG